MRRFSRFAAMPLLLAASACTSSEPSRFYVLAPVESAAPAGATTATSAPAIAVGPVEVPKYADRAEIVSFASATRLDLAEFDRWGEPLPDNIARVVAENLSRMLPSDRVVVYSGRRTLPFRYQVAIDVYRFDIEPTGKATLSASWGVQSNDGRAAVPSRRFMRSEDAGSTEIEAKVAAMSRAVAALSREIADAVRGLPAQ